MVSQEEKRIFSDSSMISQIFIHICGVVLHSLLLYAFGKDPLKCFKNLKMSFIINLAIADFLVCLISPCGLLVKNVTGVSPIVEFAARSCGNASLLTIASISVDRFLMVVYPIVHRQWTNRKKIAIWLSCIWLISICYALKRFIFGVEQNYEELVYGGLAAALFLLAAVSYASVYIALKRQSKNIAKQNNPSRTRAEEVRLLKEKKFLRTIVIIASITVVSFIPGFIFIGVLANRIMPVDSVVFQIISYISSLLMVINFAINPLIYFFRFPNYRRTFKILYCQR